MMSKVFDLGYPSEAGTRQRARQAGVFDMRPCLLDGSPVLLV